MKKGLLVCITIMLMLSSACENVETTSTAKNASEHESETDESIIPKSTAEYCDGVWTNLDNETEKSFYGTWKVEKLLGFANSYNDASEYPTGQKIIGDELIIQKDFFSSKGLKNYHDYQHELKNHYIGLILYAITLTLFIVYFKQIPIL